MPLLKSKPMPELKDRTADLSFEAIGTSWQLSYTTDLHTKTAIDAEIHALIETFDHQYSRFNADSLVTEISRSAGTYVLPETAAPLMAFYEKLYAATRGLVTPLIGQLMSDAGYDATYSLQPQALALVPSWNEAMSYTSPLLTTHLPVLLDFGAAGKGYLVDLIAQLLRRRDCEVYTINAGGDIFSSVPIRVALEHPNLHNEAIGVANIAGQALCGSAGNRRTWDRFTHIINPETKQSPRSIDATWVVADSAMVADGLATALFFVEPTTLLHDFQFGYAVLSHDALYASDNFPAEFFYQTEGAS